MVRIRVSTRDGIESEVEGEEGLSVMETIRENGFDELLALCGGCCSCATCHVHVDADDLGRLPPMGAGEDDLLETSDYRIDRSRLSCQIILTAALEGLRVRIAPED